MFGQIRIYKKGYGNRTRIKKTALIIGSFDGIMLLSYEKKTIAFYPPVSVIDGQFSIT